MGKIFANKREKVGNTMSILGIENRTENWKTVEAFTPLLSNEEARYRLAQKLLNNLDENLDCSPEDVKLQLFWNGVRDYLHWKDEQEGSPKSKKEDRYAKPLAKTYRTLFPSLRNDIDKLSSLKLPNDWNYQSTDKDKDVVEKLFHNLHGTEMDIVLDTPSHLFVGEAKVESGPGTNGTLVLVHQLIRQYVTAKVLLHFTGNSDKEVRLFSVVKKRKSFLRTYQVKFVLKKGWLCKANILTWDDINKLSN